LRSALDARALAVAIVEASFPIRRASVPAG